MAPAGIGIEECHESPDPWCCYVVNYFDDIHELLVALTLERVVSLKLLTTRCADSERWQAMLDQDLSGGLLPNAPFPCTLLARPCAQDSLQ